MKDYYKILGLSPNTSQADIRKEYLRLARLNHPDMKNTPESTSTMQKINEAYLILGDSAKRLAYDAEYTRFKTFVNDANVHADAEEKSASYAPSSEILKSWMDEASLKAREMCRQAVRDTKGMIVESGSEAIGYVVWGGLTFLIILLISAIFS